MAEFAYNNTKKTSISYTFFKLNYKFYPQGLFKEDIDPCSRFCLANKLANKLKKLIKVCC